MSDVAELMKRCQRGVGGRNALDEAHDIMAECYGTLGRLESERAALEAKCASLENSLLAITARHFAESWKKRTSDAELEQYLSAGIAQIEAERELLRLNFAEYNEAIACYHSERDNLRHQLAERDAQLLAIASAEPSLHTIEWAKAMAAAGNNEAYVKWREAFDQRDKLAGLLQGIRTMNASGLSAMTKEQIDTALSELTP